MPNPKTLPDFLDLLSDVSEESDGYLAVCPGHDDSKPSLRVAVGRTGKVLLKCRAGCTTDHVVETLGLDMAALSEIDTGKALTPIARSTSLPATPGAIAGLAMRLDGYAGNLGLSWTTSNVDDDIDAAAQYAEDRFGVDRATAERLGLGFTTDLGGNIPRLVVPFRTPAGVARNFQARALDPTAKVRWQGPKSPEGGSWSPLGWFPGESGWSEILICEGPGDALTGAAAGYDTVGVAGAARVNNPAIVDEIAEWVKGRPVVIAGDGDPAGRQFSATLSKELTDRGVSVRALTLPDGVDLNDWRLREANLFQAELIRAIDEAAVVTTASAIKLQWDETKFSFTELGAARYLQEYARSLGRDVRYEPQSKRFYLLDNGVWQPDYQGAVDTMAQEVADRIRQLTAEALKEANRTDDSFLKQYAARAAKLSAIVQSARGIAAIVELLKKVRGVAVRPDQFDQHPFLLAFINGVVDLRDGTLRQHDPTLYLTRRIEFSYKPDAQAPRWEQFLKEVFPEQPEMPSYYQRIIGYGITGDTSEQCLVVHVGSGANGKSLASGTISEIFDPIAETVPFATFERKPSTGGPQPAVIRLRAARLAYASEGESGKHMAEALIKELTGQDRITARDLYSSDITFRPGFLIQLTSNTKPVIRGQDDGIWRRIKLIEWARTFAPSERDPNLHKKLMAEAEGIIAWAVRGAVEWYRGNGDGFPSLRDPERIQQATEQYRDTSDTLSGFIGKPGQHALFEYDRDGKVEATSVFSAFQAWTEEENLRDMQQYSRRAFYSMLEERKVFRKRSTGGKYVLAGIRRARQTAEREDWAAPQQERPLLSGTMEGADVDNL